MPRRLVPVVTGEQKLTSGLERARIRGCWRSKQEFPKLDMVLVGVTESWLVARGHRRPAGVPVIHRQ